jgi:hypothetical protein
MSDLQFIVIMSLVALGYFSVGFLWGVRKVKFWRIEWIKLEHDLARAQKRDPRDIDDYEKSLGADDEH